MPRYRITETARAALREFAQRGRIALESHVARELARYLCKPDVQCFYVPGRSWTVTTYELTPLGRARALSLTPGSPERERTLRPCRLATCAACRRRMGVGRLRRHERFECEKTPAALRAALLEQMRDASEAVTRAIAAGKDCPADLLLGRLTPTPIDPSLIAWGEALIERLRLHGIDYVRDVEPAALALMLSPAKPDGGTERAERIERARACRRDAVWTVGREICVAIFNARSRVNADLLGFPDYRRTRRGFGVFVPSITRARMLRVLDAHGAYVTANDVLRALVAARALGAEPLIRTDTLGFR